MKELCSREMAELNRIYKETDSIYARYAASQKISPTMLCLLYSIYTENPPCTQSQLAEDWNIPIQTVNSCLKSMERKGIIRMIFADGSQKNKHILLTEAGEPLAKQVVVPLIRAENQALEGLDAEERRQLLTLTRKHSRLLQTFLLQQE